MKILCSLSGLDFTCDHFPGTFFSKETYHPIFNLSQHRLLSYAGKWGAGELTPTDSYLLFIALLKSTDRVDFRVAVRRSEQTNSIVAQNMEHLMKITTKMNTIANPAVLFPKYVVSPDTCNLATVRYWLDNWYSCYSDFQAGRVKDWDDRKLIQRENALDRLLKDHHKSIKDKAGQIAEWASIAAEFPTGMTPNPWSRTGEQIALSEYWKLLIIKAASDYGLLGATKQIKDDYAEMMEHCYCEIPQGTIRSHALFSILRGAMERQKNYLGFDLDTSKPKFTFLSDEPAKTDDIETVNLRVMIGTAPSKEPLRVEYASNFMFLKAKLAWEYAQKALKEKELQMHRRADDPVPGAEPAIDIESWDTRKDLAPTVDEEQAEDDPEEEQILGTDGEVA